jgi:DUF4097 and DUF4098 domain-containing protein YvlB
MKRYMALTGLTLTICAFAWAQDNTGNRVVVPARNSARPRLVKVSLQNASITVKSHAGKDVIVESASPSRRREEQRSDGLRRIDLPFGGFNVEEEDNTITIHGNSSMGGNLIVTVPPDTNLQLRSTQGSLIVEGVRGEIDASSTNGKIELTNVSGTVVAETTNGSIRASMDRVAAGKPISFSSTNGSIEVSLPADLKANLKMRSYHGSIWTDFEMNVTGSRPVTSSGGDNARFEVKFDRTMYATINGGGLDASFSTLNGRIVIKKK